jgi:hypothetical protein
MVNGRNTKSTQMNNRKIRETGIYYPEWFWEQGLRFGDLLIQVGKGKTEQVAREVYQKFDNVLVTSWRINTMANLVVQAYYETSLELKEMIEGILSIDNVERVEFSEYVQIVDRRDYDQVEKGVGKLRGA